MKIIKAIVVLVFALAFCLGGCGEAKSSAPPQEEESLSLQDVDEALKRQGSAASVSTVGNPDSWYEVEIPDMSDPNIKDDEQHFLEYGGKMPDDTLVDPDTEYVEHPIAVSFYEETDTPGDLNPLLDFVTVPVTLKTETNYAAIFDCSMFPTEAKINVDALRFYYAPKKLPKDGAGQIVFSIVAQDDLSVYEAVVAFKAGEDVDLHYEVVKEVEEEESNKFALMFWATPASSE